MLGGRRRSRDASALEAVVWPCSDLNVPRPPDGSPNLFSKVNAERSSRELYTTVFAKLRIIHPIPHLTAPAIQTGTRLE